MAGPCGGGRVRVSGHVSGSGAQQATGLIIRACLYTVTMGATMWRRAPGGSTPALPAPRQTVSYELPTGAVGPPSMKLRVCCRGRRRGGRCVYGANEPAFEL